ncbi:hypothetical protein [Antrihabitans spumae]|uniref:Uncharacterized protein n=1 Tax=Antrihabitans spumae TaxID=3373370 RepID=A0ABW7KCK8_9NOCA
MYVASSAEQSRGSVSASVDEALLIRMQEPTSDGGASAEVVVREEDLGVLAFPDGGAEDARVDVCSAELFSATGFGSTF